MCEYSDDSSTRYGCETMGFTWVDEHCEYGLNVVLAKFKNSEKIQAILKRQANDSEEEEECELFAETWTACGQMVGDEYVWDPWTGCCWTEQEFCSLSGGEWDETSGSCIWWFFDDGDTNAKSANVMASYSAEFNKPEIEGILKPVQDGEKEGEELVN